MSNRNIIEATNLSHEYNFEFLVATLKRRKTGKIEVNDTFISFNTFKYYTQDVMNKN